MKCWLPAGGAVWLFATCMLLTGCFKDNISKQYTLMTPVYASKATVLENIKSEAPRNLESPGKIFIQGRYIFVNELDKGIHIIDNSNPAAPRQVTFIKIPGNVDMAVRGSYLYADMYKDLLTIDISDPLNARLINDIPDVFPERYYGPSINDSAYIIVDWITKDTMVDVDDEPILFSWPNMMAFSSDMSQSKGNYVPGIAGSMARFSIVNNYLYAINQSFLKSFDLSSPSEPVERSSTMVGWNIETLYPFEGKLFVGSTTGMFIYEINDPANPTPAGTFTHAVACDPVIADGKYAFITLRTGTLCRGNNNQLDIVDVSDIHNPRMVKSYLMTNPAGLAKDGDALFICDGTNGLKVFDASNVQNIKLMSHLEGIETYDVIAWNKLLLMVGGDGIFQYDYTDLASIKLLSKIVVKRK